jgi:hypothetical protein
MKKLFVLIAAITALSSCSNDKKVRARLISMIDGKASSAIYLVEVDPMYRIGDTVYVNRNKYVIVK